MTYMDVGSAVYAGAINCLPCRLLSGIHASEDLYNPELALICLLGILDTKSRVFIQVCFRDHYFKYNPLSGLVF